MITLYHCADARSLRPLWALEEMGLDYDLKLLPFPPRVLAKEYLAINPLGTIPFFIDGDARMTESSGICAYLVAKYGPTPLEITTQEADYAAYLNWLFFSDATLTFPQTIVLRYTRLEPEERRLPQAAEDYGKWFLGRLKAVEAALADREFLVGGRFTIADICIAYALHLADSLAPLMDRIPPLSRAYLERLRLRPAFQRAMAKQKG
ncbi:MAG: glutathione S-transferase family protein [Hyphomonadaceae bacterium]|nr:MAG: glutathione S-transferase [Caulobacteraceae bacterium]MBT9447454.1 glutathione S-transferase family protein [Hyphomonadaceae bacterium]TPW08762.1 MAG: glutathione S-transferase [Alphaproteobacteria bacterium]